MKYVYNSLFLFAIMLAVLWFGSGSSASGLAEGPSGGSRPDASAEHCSFRQSDTPRAQNE